jgi:selenocysteine lyase/cysteine desulfurase
MNEQVLAGFSHFRLHQGELLHCTAHSHHPWPDCTREAHLQTWTDAATHTDAKWDKVFEQIVPEAQAHIARELNLSAPTQIAFAPNTHEFVTRLYSCLDWTRPLKLLTTAHEFHSFNRQTRRMEETGRLQVTRVQAAPYDDFEARFTAAAHSSDWDMIWLSQVHFDSGLVTKNFHAFIKDLPEKTIVVVDGYHAFMAMPVDWSRYEDRVFYVAGGYKYAMAGEGACFLVVPKSCQLRPVNTGWYADFAGLANPQGEVGYADDGARFFGATFDPSALYRFNAVQRWLQRLGITTAQIHAHVQRLQQQFLQGLSAVPALPRSTLTPPDGMHRGNFLTFDLGDVTRAEAIEARLNAAQIRIDRRGARLRFGFGLYHDARFIDALLIRLRSLKETGAWGTG